VSGERQRAGGDALVESGELGGGQERRVTIGRRRPVLELEASAYCVRFRAGALPGALLVCLGLSGVPCLSPSPPGAWAEGFRGTRISAGAG